MANPQQSAQILSGFYELRQAQRAINTKIIELEHDLNEHLLVVDALHSVNSERKCFRMIGGVLVEKNVGKILPSIIENKDMIAKTIDALKSKAAEKSQEIKEYLKKYPEYIPNPSAQRNEEKP